MATLIVTVPLLQPWPLQPMNLESAPAVAFKVTTVALSNNAEQVGPQLIPAGVLITLPLPVPFLVSDRENFVWELSELNVALQVLATSIIIFPLPHPVPLQPPNVEPTAGVAVKVTRVPLLNDAAHVPPQLMPAGLLVTVPFPVPLLVPVFTKFIVSVNCCADGGGIAAAGVVPQTSGA